MSDQVVARLRWSIGMVTGGLLGFGFGQGAALWTTHPWRTISIAGAALALLLLDWLVLDDDGDGEDYWR